MLEIVRVAIFADPGRTRQQLVVALHVAERRARDDGTVEIGPLVHRRADQHAAVGATGDGDLARLANAGADQMLRHRVEIVERSEEHTSELQSLMRNSYAFF